MPLYDLQCPCCKKDMEHRRGPYDDNPLCPKCKVKMTTLIRAANFHLVGEGWSSKDIKEDRNLERVL